MTEKFKVLAKYIKDMSSETPDVETYISAGNNMSKSLFDNIYLYLYHIYL